MKIKYCLSLISISHKIAAAVALNFPWRAAIRCIKTVSLIFGEVNGGNSIFYDLFLHHPIDNSRKKMLKAPLILRFTMRAERIEE